MLKEHRRKANAEHWEKIWASLDVDRLIRGAKHSILFSIFKKHLPKKGLILEGGCGNGQWVKILSEEGYNIIGLDYAKKTINKLKKMFPNKNFVFGDLEKMKYEDNSFSSHISRGVIEHFVDGPDKIVSEINRTLKKGGILIITTPYYNPLKKLKYLFRNRKGDGQFYQYHLTFNELYFLFKDHYKLKAVYYTNPFKTLKDELHIQWFYDFVTQVFRKNEKMKKDSKNKVQLNTSKFISLVENNQFINRLIGHSICLVLERK